MSGSNEVLQVLPPTMLRSFRLEHPGFSLNSRILWPAAQHQRHMPQQRTCSDSALRPKQDTETFLSEMRRRICRALKRLSWNHAAFEQFVHDRSRYFVDKFGADLRIVAQDL